MTHLLLLAVPWVAMSAWLVYTLLTNRQLRRQIARRTAEDAERAARALGNMVLVDGVELPKPEDERWRLETVGVARRPGEKVPVLVLGVVKVGGLEVFGYNQVWITVQPLDMKNVSNANKKYADEVWRCYRTRVVRKSVNGE